MDCIEPFGVPDVYVSGLAEIEVLAGGVFRFTFYTTQKFAGSVEKVVVAKIVMPEATLSECLGAALANEAIGPFLHLNG